MPGEGKSFSGLLVRGLRERRNRPGYSAVSAMEGFRAFRYDLYDRKFVLISRCEKEDQYESV